MKRWITLVIALYLALIPAGIKVIAEITSPYTVDEKAQVTFGDSTAVSGYEGLQNYTTDYVGGYLHITFTYTHHSCCFSSYPPSLYITALDPRTTTTPTERAENIIYQLLAGTHGTDWYSYDIQFDATGYTAIVKRAGVTEIENSHTTVSGLTSTDWAALTNDYPISPATNFSMSFTPLLIQESTPSSSSSSAASNSVSSHGKSGDRLRCVETSTGLYCPSEQVREYYTLETMQHILTLMQLMINEIAKERGMQPV